jgi:hypothetical protein
MTYNSKNIVIKTLEKLAQVITGIQIQINSRE